MESIETNNMPSFEKLPYQTVFGIRQKKTYKFLDKIGEVVDSLLQLQGQNSFPEKCFAFIQKASGGFRLANAKGENATFHLKCGVDGIVLTSDYETVKPAHLPNMFDNIVNISQQLYRADNSADRFGVVNFFKFEKLANVEDYLDMFNITDKNDIAEMQTRLVFGTNNKDANFNSKIIEMAVIQSSEIEGAFDLFINIDFQDNYRRGITYKKDFVAKTFTNSVQFCNEFLTTNFPKV